MARKLIVEIVGDSRSYERSLNRATQQTNRFGREVSKTTRGVAAGSGLFRTLGRSLAFASGGFIAAAGAADLIRGSIQQAGEAAAAQKQLAAQFQASGQNLAQYKEQIDAATHSVSVLAGFEDDQLTQAFTTAFRGSNDVSVALKIQAAAADAARGAHKDLQQTTLALTKAYGGQSTALKRLGILIPAHLHGMAALNFVQEKFAGQAQAGTTAQERFSAAFKNFEEVVGTALLPTFNRLLGNAAKWLNDTQNQKKAQDAVNKAVKFGTGVMHGLAQITGIFIKGLGPGISKLHSWANALERANTWSINLEKSTLRLVGLGGLVAGPGGIAPSKLPGQSTADRRAGLSPGGAGSFPPMPAGGTVRRRASLAYQISLAQEALAKAELTAGQKDDRAILVRLAVLYREKIAKTTDLAKRTALYQQLGSVTEQVRAIDAKATADQQAARQKQIDAAAAAKAKAQAQADKLKQAMADMRDKFQSALDSARAGIGELFQGPVLAPTSVQVRTRLGEVPGGNLGGMTSDLKAQTAQFRRFQKDLARLRKAGAPGELVKELGAQGVAALPQIESILGGGKGARQQFFKAFRAREQLAIKTARMDVNATRVVIGSGTKQPIEITITLDGKVVAKSVTTHQTRHRRKTSSSTRGRDGGN